MFDLTHAFAYRAEQTSSHTHLIKSILGKSLASMTVRVTTHAPASSLLSTMAFFSVCSTKSIGSIKETCCICHVVASIITMVGRSAMVSEHILNTRKIAHRLKLNPLACRKCKKLVVSCSHVHVGLPGTCTVMQNQSKDFLIQIHTKVKIQTRS